MALIGKNDGVQAERKYKEFDLPATVRSSDEGISLKSAFIISTLLHPAVLGTFALTVFILSLLGIDLKMLQ